MPNPATFEPLRLTNYSAEKDEFAYAPEGKHLEHYTVRLPNGYAVALCRAEDLTDVLPGLQEAVGYQDGLWEASLMRPATGLAKVFGQEFEVAEELNDLTTDTVVDESNVAGGGEWRVIGNLDNAGIDALLDTIAERPAPVVEEQADPFTDFLQAFLSERSEEGSA